MHNDHGTLTEKVNQNVLVKEALSYQIDTGESASLK